MFEGAKGLRHGWVPLGTGSRPQQHGNNWVIVSVPLGTRLRWGIPQTRLFPLVPLTFPAQANPLRCSVSTATVPQPARRDGSSWPRSPLGTIQGQRRCGDVVPASPFRAKVGADKSTRSASSRRSRDLANGVHLLGSSWNNKLYHPKKQNHKRGSACSPAHKSPLSGGSPNLQEKTPFNQRKEPLRSHALPSEPRINPIPWQASPGSPRARGIPTSLSYRSIL